MKKVKLILWAILSVAMLSGSSLLRDASSDDLEHNNTVVGQTWIVAEDYGEFKEYGLMATNISGKDLILTIDIKFMDNGDVVHLVKTIPATANTEKRAVVVFHSDRKFDKVKDSAKANPSLW